MVTYYSLLGVEQTASSEELKAAYHRQLLSVHPDKATGSSSCSSSSSSSDAFQQLQEAWEVGVQQWLCAVDPPPLCLATL
jgi:DnaJ-class molecular chaperone